MTDEEVDRMLERLERELGDKNPGLYQQEEFWGAYVEVSNARKEGDRAHDSEKILERIYNDCIVDDILG